MTQGKTVRKEAAKTLTFLHSKSLYINYYINTLIHECKQKKLAKVATFFNGFTSLCMTAWTTLKCKYGNKLVEHQAAGEAG